jgi:hypothetical protein
MWLKKYSETEIQRCENNISRLNELKLTIHKLKYIVFASQSDAYQQLSNLLKMPLVKGRHFVLKKLQEAYIGENNQKIALDSPHAFKEILDQAEELIQLEINKEKLNLRKLNSEKK